MIIALQTPEPPDETSEPDAQAAQFQSLRDERRSARRWQDLLSLGERRQILAEIARVTLAIGRDLYPEQNLSDLDIGAASGQGDVCPRERLAFLVGAWPRIANALRIIEASPATTLAPGGRNARVEQGSLRRVSPAALFAALRSGDYLSAPASAGPLARRLQGRLPRRITEMTAAPTYDTPINRAIKGILAQIVRDLSRIAALAQATEAPDVARQAENLRETVRRHLRGELWRNLTPAPVRNAYPPAAHPAYRFVFDQWRRYRNSFAFDWTNPVFTLPARETWVLYEYSCLFMVADALHHLGFRATSAEGFAVSRSGLTFGIEKGHTSRLTFQKAGMSRVTLSYNPSFSRRDTESAGGWRSRSHALRPDMTLELDGSLLIFDAKFKTYAEPDAGQSTWRFRDGTLLPDIQQMHTYRDAIVHGDKTNVVAEAWLLYAGRRDTSNPNIVAYPPSTALCPFGIGRVGALLLRPGQAESLRAFLHWFLTKRDG